MESILELEMDWEALAATLEVGDHFAVIIEKGNNEGSIFWILICEEPLHVVEEERKIDSWGQVVFQGEHIVIGKYYKQHGRSSMSYVLCNGGPVMIYSHFIFAAKFTMQGVVHRQRGGRHGGTQVINIFYHVVYYIRNMNFICFSIFSRSVTNN
jgi:hypothetical protein